MPSSNNLARCLLRGESYFGPEMSAMQGPPLRHGFFLPTAKMVCGKFKEPIRILEIGSWAGASAITWVKAFLELGRPVTIDCVDTWAPYFDINLEKHEHYLQMNEAAESDDIYKLFLHNIRAEKIDAYVNIHRGRSHEILSKLDAESYHLIYIDASHLYLDVQSDVRWAKRLILDGGIICGDDLEIQANQVSSQELHNAVKSGIDFTSVASGGSSFHPGVTLAISEEFGLVSSWQGYWAVSREAGKSQPIVLDLSNANLPAHIKKGVAFQDADKQRQFAHDLSKTNLPAHIQKCIQFQVELISQGEKYNIARADGRYIAVLKALGPINLFQELVGERTLGDAIILDENLENLKRRVKELSL